MLIIREDQHQALRAQSLAQFEKELGAHALAFSPHHAATLGDEQLLMCVHTAYLRARSQGFTLRGPVRLWFDLTFMFGMGFDTDPQLRTVSCWLDRPVESYLGGQLERASELRERAKDFAARVAGESGAPERAAIARFRVLSLDYLDSQSDDEIIDLLSYLHPEKVSVIGTPALLEIIERGRSQAQSLGLTDPAGPAAVTMLMFAFGHECMTDPLFPWIAQSLRQGERDARVRLERARRIALRFITHE